MTLLISLVVAVLCISFLCSLLESVLLSLNMSYINSIEEKNKKYGTLLKKIKTDIDKSISSILIVNTLSNTLGATMVGTQAKNVFGDSDSIFIVSVVFTLLILFFSEIIPKTIGAIYYKPLAITAARIINLLIFISYPLIVVSTLITSSISKNKGDSEKVSKDELLQNVLIGEKHGVISDRQSDIIENTIASSSCRLHDVLTPRSVVYSIDIKENIQDILDNELIYRYSRVPIYDGDIDHIVGVMLAKSLFKLALENKDTLKMTLQEVYDMQTKEIKNSKNSKQITPLIGNLSTMNENIPVINALSYFVKSKEHMIGVVDKYGQTEGIVTLEDCMEQVLGVEIVDESDVVEDMQELASAKMKNKRANKANKKV